MEEKVKHRLVGVAVIVAIFAIFAPMLFRHAQHPGAVNNLSQFKAPPAPAKPQLAVIAAQHAQSNVQSHAQVTKAKPVAATTHEVARAKPSTSTPTHTPKLDQAKNNKSQLVAVADKPKQQARAKPKATSAKSGWHFSLLNNQKNQQSQNSTAKQKITVATKHKSQARPQHKIAKDSHVTANKHHASKKIKHVAKKQASTLRHNPHRKTKPVAKWTVQLGTFSKPLHAEKLVWRLQHHGFHPYTRKVTNSKGRKFTKVFVGRQAGRTAAKSLQTKLQQLVKLKGIVVKYPKA